MTSVVAADYVVKIPDEIARQFGIGPGTQLEWAVGPDNTILITPILSRGELARQFLGSGRKYLKPGADPIGDLLREREEDDKLDQEDERM
jgi:bifunctional DNA-binding transcriptional regulator/antitoxin component of YhaV-PrlF toxin-antitoxin module